jgi:hypothetical protein
MALYAVVIYIYRLAHSHLQSSIQLNGTIPLYQSCVLANNVPNLTYLDPPHIRRLLAESLPTHVQAVLANQARLFLLAIDDATLVSLFVDMKKLDNGADQLRDPLP